MEKLQIDALSKDVLNSTELAKSTFKDVSDDEDRDFLQLFTLVCLLSFDVYMKKNIIESLIDDTQAAHCRQAGLRLRKRLRKKKGKRRKRQKKQSVL